MNYLHKGMDDGFICITFPGATQNRGEGDIEPGGV